MTRRAASRGRVVVVVPSSLRTVSVSTRVERVSTLVSSIGEHAFDGVQRPVRASGGSRDPPRRANASDGSDDESESDKKSFIIV